MLYESPACPGITTIVADPEDIALAKVVAWREKDKDWLKSGLRSGIFSLDRMVARLPRMPDAAPASRELTRRLAWLASECSLPVGLSE